MHIKGHTPDSQRQLFLIFSHICNLGVGEKLKIDGWGVLWKMKGIRRKQDKGEIIIEL